MENSIGSAIEKIKILEQDKEAKLKEKREYDGSVALLQRSVRDITNETEKLREEQNILNEKITKLNAQLKVEQIRKKTLIDQIEALKADVHKIKNKVITNISDVWKIRASFCETVQKTSDGYSAWALLMKPVDHNYVQQSEPKLKHNLSKKKAENDFLSNTNKLQAVTARRNNAIEKRNLLLLEPEKGDEFLRIKNALRYSQEKISSLKSQTIF